MEWLVIGMMQDGSIDRLPTQTVILMITKYLVRPSELKVCFMA